jgi:hypothetical protein
VTAAQIILTNLKKENRGMAYLNRPRPFSIHYTVTLNVADVDRASQVTNQAVTGLLSASVLYLSGIQMNNK